MNPPTYWAESREQCATVSYLRRCLPRNYRVASFPNGRFKTDPKTVVRLKREGMHPGIWDLVVMRNDGWWCALEFKSGKGSLSQAQIEWGDWMAEGRASCAVVRSMDEALEALAQWGVPMRGRIAA